jgi:nucleoside-diphosphate-sugar epimerase
MTMTANRVLVTGATGFVGSHLCRRLISDGFEVHAIVRTGSDLTQLEGSRSHLSVHPHDGSMANMLGIMSACKPEIVFHLASLFISQHDSDDVEDLINSNITFGTQLAEAMAVNRIPYLVNTGTAWQHYEDKNYNPVCLYAATKQAFEALMQFYIEASCLRLITLKLFDTYGPFDLRPKLFSILRNVKGQESPLLMSPGEQLLDLVYIDDVVDAFCIAGQRLKSDKVNGVEDYAVSSGKVRPLKEVVQLYAKVSGKKLKIHWGGRTYRSREVMVPWKSGTPLPGWRPKIPLEKGIQMMRDLDGKR